MRNAFNGLDREKSGKITPQAFRFYLTHWGMQVSEEKFKELFDSFDEDGDGVISYRDFQRTAGKVM